MARESLQTYLQGLKDLGDAFGEMSKRQAFSQFEEDTAKLASEIEDPTVRQVAIDTRKQQFGLKLAKLGVPTSTIKEIGSMFEGRFSKAQSAEAVYLDPRSTPDQLDRAELLMAKKRRDKLVELSSKQDDKESKKQERLDKRYSDFTKRIDATLQVRSAFGRAARQTQLANDVEAIVGRVKSKDHLSLLEVTELAEAFGSMVKGGQQVTKEELEHILPRTLGIEQAKVKQFLSGQVQPANAGDFVDLFLKGARRQRVEAESEISETMMSQSRGFFDLAKEDPKRFKETMAAQFQRFGQPIEPEDIIIDLKNGRVTTKKLEENNAHLEQAMKAWKHAKKLIKSADKQDQETAREIFKTLDVNEKATPREALSTLRIFVSRGRFERE